MHPAVAPNQPIRESECASHFSSHAYGLDNGDDGACLELLRRGLAEDVRHHRNSELKSDLFRGLVGERLVIVYVRARCG
ncbi:hypothetical protein RSOLAG1IB_05658 [Rhizoctonia solani AG-1 IB]|uniref:Uncharacterized protein n=1 Tax=Thanatephorus cucumeris (strain AG1-IB / isolate 7/3/14) TaxID=1108050 RepID=A0A0B7G5W7_THACB|nr:hypothetical protein RSOLAG1IB_05658 [Rhizoctonia solani AG-1 IB]